MEYYHFAVQWWWVEFKPQAETPLDGSFMSNFSNQKISTWIKIHQPQLDSFSSSEYHMQKSQTIYPNITTPVSEGFPYLHINNRPAIFSSLLYL